MRDSLGFLTKKGRPSGRPFNSLTIFGEAARAAYGGEEEVSTPTQAGTPKCVGLTADTPFVLVALSLTVRLRLTSLALAGGEASGEDRATVSGGAAVEGSCLIVYGGVEDALRKQPPS